LLLNWGQATGKWLIRKRAYTLEWPAEVKERIGKALQRGKGWD
jgi:hypothetical protein